jgi:hypothetical protein
MMRSNLEKGQQAGLCTLGYGVWECKVEPDEEG